MPGFWHSSAGQTTGSLPTHAVLAGIGLGAGIAIVAGGAVGPGDALPRFRIAGLARGAPRGAGAGTTIHLCATAVGDEAAPTRAELINLFRTARSLALALAFPVLLPVTSLVLVTLLAALASAGSIGLIREEQPVQGRQRRQKRQNLAARASLQ